MSLQSWHRCDFPKCEKRATWVVRRPPVVEQTIGSQSWQWAQAQNYTVIGQTLPEEWCNEHAEALVRDAEAFLAEMKAT